ncbi:MAG: succinate dehydrogenase, cytochrome b556 subunit [Anaerolineae bacterium]|nr:succinate dehydrogenase, cytochrome b556 subunit [Anaerolineae bacterium]
MSTFIPTVRETFRYKGKEGQLAWIGHRLGGLGTLIFFIIHVVDTSWVYFWPQGYHHAIVLYRSWPFQIGELLLVLLVIYHGLNGLRITLMDWKPTLWRYQRQMTLGTFGLTVLFYIPAFIIMGSHALKNLLGIELF